MAKEDRRSGASLCLGDDLLRQIPAVKPNRAVWMLSLTEERNDSSNTTGKNSWMPRAGQTRRTRFWVNGLSSRGVGGTRGLRAAEDTSGGLAGEEVRGEGSSERIREGGAGGNAGRMEKRLGRCEVSGEKVGRKVGGNEGKRGQGSGQNRWRGQEAGGRGEERGGYLILSVSWNKSSSSNAMSPMSKPCQAPRHVQTPSPLTDPPHTRQRAQCSPRARVEHLPEVCAQAEADDLVQENLPHQEGRSATAGGWGVWRG